MRKTPERIEALAAEYVLGTLQGMARHRFERWMMESWRVRQEVWFWEQHLGVLLDNVPEVTAPDSAWPAIAERLGFAEYSPARTPGTPWLSRLWALASSAAAIALAAMLFLAPPAGNRVGPAYIAVVSHQQQPLWIMDGEAEARQLHTRAVAASEAGADKDYELWILPEGGAPLSLGVLPADGRKVVIELSDAQRRALLGSRKLAISLEPRGGSPTGRPTGPVLYTTELLSL